MANKIRTKSNIVVISGSVREKNYTRKAINLLIDELKKRKNIFVSLIDPRKIRISFPGLEIANDDVDRLQKKIFKAAGVILATPEYNGSFSSMLKLIIENLGYPSALSGKPIGLLGVASGQIGAVKSLEHLRSVCSHVGGIVLPEPISVGRIIEVFDEKGNCLDPIVEKQIRSVAINLVTYIADHIWPKESLEELVRGKNAGT